MKFSRAVLGVVAAIFLAAWTHGSTSVWYSVWNQANLVDGDLHVLMSNDGHSFFVRSSYVKYVPHDSTMCGIPAIMFNSGKLWVLCSQGITLAWTGTTIEIASSSDGDNYTYVASVSFSDVAIGAHPEVWGTSWFVDSDASVHIIAIVTADSTASPDIFVLYEKHCTDMTFSSCSASTQMTGTALPNSMIDGRIIKIGSTYNLFYKNETVGSHYVEVASSTSLTSGYTVIESGNWAGWGQNLEAPDPVGLGGNNWRIYLDPLGGGMRWSESTTGLFGTWTAPVSVTSPISLQHGSVIPNPVGG
jgi:hypothetical protein